MKRGDRHIVALDLETGGFVPEAHGILALGGYWQNFTGVEHKLRILVEREPDTEVDPAAAAKCGWVSDEQWLSLGAIPLAEALALFERWLVLLVSKLDTDKLEPLAHNHASVDRPFLEYWAGYYGRLEVMGDLLSHAWHDSMTTLRAAQVAGLVPADGGASLDAMSKHMGRPRRSAVHDACEDAMLCHDGYHWLTELMRRGRR